MQKLRIVWLPKLNLKYPLHDPYPRKWACHGEYYINGYGDTPVEAYADWIVKFNTVIRIPRKGVWNEKDCREWFTKNKTGYTVYREGRSRMIVGYDFNTDELVLRG